VIQATAMGTSTQMVRWSTSTSTSTSFLRRTIASLDRRLQSLRQHGLVGALDRMKGKGRFRTPYGVGNELSTSLNCRRTRDAGISGWSRIAELPSVRPMPPRVPRIQPRRRRFIPYADGKGSEGTALPACKLKVDKKTQQIEIETFQNPGN